MVIGSIFNSSQFSYDKEQKMFMADISEVPSALRQLWNDSMDLGFGIRSERTGSVVFYTLSNIERDRDGDVLTWLFEPTQMSCAMTPGATYTSVVIIND